MQVILEKQFHNQLSGVAAALGHQGAPQRRTHAVAPWALPGDPWEDQ